MNLLSHSVLLAAEGTSVPVVAPDASAGGVFDLLWLVIALPLLGAFVLLGVAPFLQGSLRASVDKHGHLVGTAAAVSSFVLSLALFVSLLGRGEEERQVGQQLWTWFETGSISVGMDLLYDQLAALFLLLITGVGSLIHVYAIGYMEHDVRRRRFFGYLNLFVAAMLTLILSANFVGLFLGWEGVGLASYLLIGFWQHKPSAAAAAKKAFVINRVGDIGLSLAIALMFATFGTTDFGAVSEMTGGADQGTLNTLGLLLLLGACGKSAQVPLQSWLLDAMEGPTPVSALIHAATMVTAGVYLVVRSNFVFELAPVAQTAVVVVATVTLLWGAILGCAKDDIKKALAGSTMSQIGYMMLAAGLGPVGYPFAIFHLLTHGFFKANMFLGAGSVMHGMDDDVDMRHYGALNKAMPVTFLTFAMGYLAIIGFPGFSGFWSKDKIIESALADNLAGRSPGHARRRHHRLLHDPPDADDLLHRAALGQGPAPARVAQGDDRAADGARRAVGPRRRAARRRLDRDVARARHRAGRAPRAAAAGDRDHPPHHPRGGVGVAAAWFLVGRRDVPREAPHDVSFATRAARADLYGDAINDAVVVRPGASLVGGLTTFDRVGVDGAVEGGSAAVGGLSTTLRRVQNGFVRSYALSLFAGALLVVLVLLAVNLG